MDNNLSQITVQIIQGMWISEHQIIFPLLYLIKVENKIAVKHRISMESHFF